MEGLSDSAGADLLVYAYQVDTNPAEYLPAAPCENIVPTKCLTMNKLALRKYFTI